ncbi:hypothetical protein MXB_795, partial [Myxobolus squamalis]
MNHQKEIQNLFLSFFVVNYRFYLLQDIPLMMMNASRDAFEYVILDIIPNAIFYITYFIFSYFYRLPDITEQNIDNIEIGDKILYIVATLQPYLRNPYRIEYI